VNDVGHQRVTIGDIDMPFGRIVVFMIKWMLASIPAMIIMYIIFAAVFGFFALIFGGLLGGMGAFM